MVAAALLFGVDWGDPAAAGLVALAFCLVGAGAGMLLSNEQQTQGARLLVGLGLAALGGSMVPLEAFPPAVRDVAHIAPHAWGNDAFSELLDRDGSLAGVLAQLAVLCGCAAVALGLSTWRLRRVITR